MTREVDFDSVGGGVKGEDGRVKSDWKLGMRYGFGYRKDER